VATVLGSALPPADRLPLLRPNGTSRGKVARAMHQWIVPPQESGPRGGTLRRIIVGPGMELLVDEQHPALRLAAGEPAVAEAVRNAIGRLLDGA
jgi:hypothetical protein